MDARLGSLEDVPSTRGLFDGRLTGSIQRLTLKQVQMDGRNSEVACPTLGSLEDTCSSTQGLLHSRSTTSADGRLMGSTGRLTGVQRVEQPRTCRLWNVPLTHPLLRYVHSTQGLLTERLTVSLGGDVPTVVEPPGKNDDRLTVSTDTLSPNRPTGRTDDR